MAGHSQFKNIMYRKMAQDKKRANLFTKLAKEIIVAAKEGGGDIDNNARLRVAVSAARSNGMPKDNIERSIKKGIGREEDLQYEYVCYEGYGPFGAAIIIDSLTDKKNRTAPELRVLFSKAGGSLAEPHAVSFLFDHLGQLVFAKNQVSSFDVFFEQALDLGANDVFEKDSFCYILCPIEQLHNMQKELFNTFNDPVSCQMIWNPRSPILFPEMEMIQINKLIKNLEEHGDVQNVFTNAIIK